MHARLGRVFNTLLPLNTENRNEELAEHWRPRCVSFDPARVARSQEQDADRVEESSANLNQLICTPQRTAVPVVRSPIHEIYVPGGFEDSSLVNVIHTRECTQRHEPSPHHVRNTLHRRCSPLSLLPEGNVETTNDDSMRVYDSDTLVFRLRTYT